MRCPRCEEDQDIEAFAWKNKAKGKRSLYCKNCMKSYIRQHYDKNRHYYITKATRRNAKQKVINHALMMNYLSEHPCVDCGENDPVVLEFDHVRGVKKRNVTDLLGWGWKTIQAEIAKCEVRCANCHRRVTAQRGNWRRAPVAQ